MDVPGRAITQSFRPVRYDEVDCEDVESLKKALKGEAVRAGGNAIVEFWSTRESERFIKGRSPKGNPYYGNRYWYTGRGIAVYAEAIRVSVPGRSHEPSARTVALVPDTNAWIDFGPSLIGAAGASVHFIVPRDVFEEIDGLKRSRNDSTAQAARSVASAWQKSPGQIEISVEREDHPLLAGLGAGMRRDGAIIACALFHASHAHRHVFLLSGDKNALTLAGELARQEGRSNLHCGGLVRLVRFLREMGELDAAERLRRLSDTLTHW